MVSLFSSCGLYVHRLLTTLGISCDWLSTNHDNTYTLHLGYVKKHTQTHSFTSTSPHYLSPSYFTNSPLMNTLFTQFPQHLLLLQRKRIKERY